MINFDKFEKVPDWKKSELNRWADWIELLCIFNQDKIMTKEDIICHLDDKYSDSLVKGTEEHSGEFDKLNQRVNDYFSIIEHREERFCEYYPFVFEDDVLSVLPQNEWTDQHKCYFFLFFCSNISFFDRSTLQKLTTYFESFCKDIMIFIMPEKAKTELFGTSKDGGFFSGNLRERIEKLAKCLGTHTTLTFNKEPKYDRISGGDDGIDIVSYVKIDDASHIPFAFAQCACSYNEWRDKQNSISLTRWKKRIEGIPTGWKFMFVPFSCHRIEGNLEEVLNINTYLMDRDRILELCAQNKYVIKNIYFEQLIKKIFD